MPADPRQKLADIAAAMWGKYDSTVRTGGTREQRLFALTQAVKAEDKLAAHVESVRERGRSELAARALSGG